MPEVQPPPTAAGPDRTPPCALVIFGASGDLTERKLLPALAQLAAEEVLPRELVLVGVARTQLSDDDFRARCRKTMSSSAPSVERLIAGARYVAGAYDDPATFTALDELLRQIDETYGTAGNRVYYLATPQHLFGPIAVRLGAAGLDKSPTGGFVRLVIEKPFGWDEESARRLYGDISSVFAEEQVFRIDHYLAKETVQNLLAVRFANAIFEPIWNRTWVDNVQITVAESIGVENRGGFYETAGAMRDIVQNHVLQVLSLFLMEPPTSFHPEAIRDEKLKLLRAIRPFKDEEDVARRAVRGQYARGGTREQPLPGYREEPGVDPVSSVETFVALRLHIDNWRWAGVPVYVRTGKRLPQRITEVAIEFQRPPQLPLFPSTDLEPDALLLQVAPSEGLSIRFGAKTPGRSFAIRKASMDFAYREGAAPDHAEAYERVIFDALVGDPTLFIRADEVGRSWRIVDPVIAHWARSAEPIPLYQAGTWGPREAKELISVDWRRWRHSGR